jgi:hypothetical protein
MKANGRTKFKAGAREASIGCGKDNDDVIARIVHLAERQTVAPKHFPEAFSHHGTLDAAASVRQFGAIRPRQ